MDAGWDGKRKERTALQRAGSPVLLKLVKDAAAALPADVGLLFFGSGDFPATSLETLQLCQYLSEAGPRIRLSVHDSKDAKALCEKLGVLFFPTLIIRGKNRGQLRFLGTPSGHCLRVLVESLSAASTGEAGLPSGVSARLASVKRPVDLKVFIRPDSEPCRRAAALAMRLAVASMPIRTEVINHLDFPVMSERYKIGSVPRTIVNGMTEINGARDGEDFIERMLGALVAQPEMYR